MLKKGSPIDPLTIGCETFSPSMEELHVILDLILVIILSIMLLSALNDFIDRSSSFCLALSFSSSVLFLRFWGLAFALRSFFRR